MGAPGAAGPSRRPPAIAGVRLAVAEAGIRYRGRTDLLLAELAEGTSVAGVFTRSRTAAAPVRWCRRVLPRGRARALVKTAIAGEDANWGRIVAAVGRSGEPIDRERLAISIGGVAVARDGEGFRRRAQMHVQAILCKRPPSTTAEVA